MSLLFIDKINVFGAKVLDFRHLGFTDEEKYKIMYMKYWNDFVADALEAGHCVETKDGKINVAIRTINQDTSIIAGYIFEALTVRFANDNNIKIGYEIFKWSTFRRRLSEEVFY